MKKSSQQKLSGVPSYQPLAQTNSQRIQPAPVLDKLGIEFQLPVS